MLFSAFWAPYVKFFLAVLVFREKTKKIATLYGDPPYSKLINCFNIISSILNSNMEYQSFFFKGVLDSTDGGCEWHSRFVAWFCILLIITLFLLNYTFGFELFFMSFSVYVSNDVSKNTVSMLCKCCLNIIDINTICLEFSANFLLVHTETQLYNQVNTVSCYIIGDGSKFWNSQKNRRESWQIIISFTNSRWSFRFSMNPFNKKFWFVWAETVNQICFTSFIKHGGLACFLRPCYRKIFYHT